MRLKSGDCHSYFHFFEILLRSAFENILIIHHNSLPNGEKLSELVPLRDETYSICYQKVKQSIMFQSFFF